MYELPPFQYQEKKQKLISLWQKRSFRIFLICSALALAVILLSGDAVLDFLQKNYGILLQEAIPQSAQPFPIAQKPDPYTSRIPYEQAIIDAVKEASPSVVSIVVSKDLPVYERQLVDPFGDFPGFRTPFDFRFPEYVQKGTELRKIGAGSGFVVSEDGLILTNKHVVVDEKAEYTVITSDQKKHSAKVLALDPVQDLAIIKVDDVLGVKPIKLGDSSSIAIGQGAIAIGNALGEFSNTVSVGVVSGLGRTISASDDLGSFSETLEGIIQTDAAINSGNSGGPLLNLKGEVIGVNTAMAEGAQSIGFAIPINVAKRDINQVIATNKIVYAFLGVRYVLVDDEVQKEYQLPVDYGAYIVRGDDGESPITPGSGAEKAGLLEGDLIVEFNGEQITKSNSLSRIIAKYNPGDKVKLKLIRGKEEKSIEVVLGERS